MLRFLSAIFILSFAFALPVSAQFLNCRWDLDNYECFTSETCNPPLVPAQTCQDYCLRNGCSPVVCNAGSVQCVSPTPVPPCTPPNVCESSATCPHDNIVPGDCGIQVCCAPAPIPTAIPTPIAPPLGCYPATRNSCTDANWTCNSPWELLYCPTNGPALCCATLQVLPPCSATPPTGVQCTSHAQCVADYQDGDFDTYCSCFIPTNGGPTCINYLFNQSGSGDNVGIFCNPDDPQAGILTALGCIQANKPKDLINQIVSWSLSIAAVSALFTLVYSGFTYVTSAGDVKKVAQAKSFLVATLSGLLVIVLAVVLLNFVGVQVLGLSSFGFGI
jgi:hypothetical protein